MNFPFDTIYEATMALLPANMKSPQAKAMLIAIGLQESRFLHRRQMNDGPAKGFWQFEQGGAVRGVLNHSLTRGIARGIVNALVYDDYPTTVWNALEHNDVLAMAFARLNLYWLPTKLPEADQAEEAWRQYFAAWQPGKPHRETWDAYYSQAWQEV